MYSVIDGLREALKDRYRIDNEIGRGGMATVYAAEDIRHARKVAIKVLSPDLTASIGADRFQREIRIAARLSHPNIVTVFDSGTADGMLYYVMPFIDGESLRAKMTRERHLAIDEAIQIACEVADSLGYAHGQGVVHRDIKPENILLQHGRVLVADFGIAHAGAGNEAEKLTGTGMTVGTAGYMSPEQATGEPVDARTDIYALGCTVYEMLAGEPPFWGSSPLAIMAKHMSEPVPSMRVVRASVPEELQAAVEKSMAKVPADRFQTMEDFKKAILGEVPTNITGLTSKYTARYRVQDRRQSLLAKVLIGVGVVVVLAGGWYAFSRRSANPAALSPDASRVAVMYFDDATGGRFRYLADGLTEQMIDRLSDISAIDVVSANGVQPFRGKDVPVDSVGRALKVGSVVRGSLEPHGDKVRVTVRLMDAAAAVDIGHKSIDLDTAQIAAQQGQLAEQVVDFLRERLGDAVRLRSERASTTSNEAWLLVEQAGKLRKDADSLVGRGDRPAAVAELDRADSVLAVAQRSDAHWSKIPARRAALAFARLNVTGATPTAAAVDDSGIAHADLALHLQPNDADALAAKGQLQYARVVLNVEPDQTAKDRMLARAESTLRRAVDLNKSEAGAWSSLSALYYRKPDIQAANLAAQSAYQADAYLSSAKSILNRLFWTSHDTEQYPEALKWCNVGRERFPDDPFFTECRLWMYTTRLDRPDVDSAWSYAAKYVQLTPAPSRVTAKSLSEILVAGALARAGLPDSARHVLLRARVSPAQDPHLDLEAYEAVVRVMVGDQDEAVRLLKDYLTVNPDHRKGFATRVSPWWRDLQTNARFRQLIAGAR
jgi:serine/threonine-protein kinase